MSLYPKVIRRKNGYRMIYITNVRGTGRYMFNILEVYRMIKIRVLCLIVVN